MLKMKKKRMKVRISVLVVSALLSTQVLCFAGTNAEVPTRSSVSEKYKWNLSELYPTRATFEADLTKVKKELLPKVAAYKGQLKDPVQFKSFMELDEQISRIVYKTMVYATFSADLNQSDNNATELLDLSDGLAGDYSQAVSFVSTELTKLSDEDFNKLYSNASLKTYKRYFDKVTLSKAHTLSDPEEAILAKLSEVAGAPSSLFSKITLADYNAPTIKDAKGKLITLTNAKYSEVLESADRDLRKRAYEAKTNSYKDQINTLAANYASQIKLDVFNASTRKYTSALESSLTSEEIPQAIYDNLVTSVNKNLSYLHKYNTVKKNYFGFDKMYAYDTSLPISGNVDTKYTYDEAVKMIAKGLAPLGNQYVADFNKGINDRWVDVYADENKYTGGYQWGTYDTHPYILMNFDNSLDESLTLAHEMGHALNSQYSNKTQDYINADYPIFTAEVASTVNELLVMDSLIKNTKNTDEKLYLIDKQIENIRGTIFTQVMYAEFEQKIHALAESDKALSPDVLNNTWLELVKKYNGKDLTVLDQSKYSWSRISHFYTSFYVYKYATSMSAAYSIVNQMNGKDSEKAVTQYLAFLSTGGTQPPVEALKLAGVDMNSSEPVDSILKYFGGLVDQYEKLLKEKKATQKKAS